MYDSPEWRACGTDNLLRRESEIGYLCPEFSVDEDVVCLQIAMDDLRLGRVQETDALGNISKNWKQQIAIERETFIMKNIVERTHVHILHNEHRFDTLFDDSAHHRCDTRVAHLVVGKELSYQSDQTNHKTKRKK